MKNTEYKKEEETTTTKSNYNIEDKISITIDAINKTNFHRLFFAMIVTGYIIIAFSGHMEDSKSVIRYSFFILFSLVMCLIIKKRLYIENKRIYINNIIKYNFKKLIFITLLMIVFLSQILEALIKLYYIYKKTN